MENNLSQTTTTDLSNVQDFSVDAQVPYAPVGNEQNTVYDYPDAAAQLGYYKTIPELKKAIDALATWTTGKGYDLINKSEEEINKINGWGEDSFQAVCWNLQVQKKVFGDAYAEIIRDPDTNEIINIKPLYPGDMRVVVDSKGVVDHYEQRTGTAGIEPKKFETRQILHLTNDRVTNEIHGVSVVDAVKWAIDARNEAMRDWRRISHRSTVRVLYVDMDDEPKLNKLKTQYQDGIKSGDVLILPVKKGDAEFEDLTLPPAQQFLQWIQYLEGFFYQAVGIPRVIATSENYTEAASKVGYLTFEPIYTREQTELENDLWNQTAIKLKFNRPPELSNMMQMSEQKNTGQTNFQPNDLKVGLNKQ